MSIITRPTANAVIFALAGLLIAPPAALAQTANAVPSRSGAAAATLPNTFDGAPARSAPLPEGVEVSEPAKVEAAETALRGAIAALQAGAPNYDAMTPGMASRMREQAPSLMPLIQGYGELVAGRYAGSQDNAELFGVAFDNAETQWVIALDEAGKIAVLLFRPAPSGEAAD